MSLKPHAIRILLTEDVIAPNAEDGMDRVASIVAPLVTGPSGGQVNPDSLKAEINSVFGWEINDDVCAVLLQRLAKYEKLERRRVGATFHFFYKNDPEGAQKTNTSTVAVFCESFRKYCLSNPPLSEPLQVAISELTNSDDRVVEFFARVLPDLNSFWSGSEQETTSEIETTEIWERTLVAEFLLFIASTSDSALVERLAELLLIRDVVSNYQFVEHSGPTTQLIVVLDTPSALSLIGVSGEQARINASVTMESAKRIGCRLAVMPATVAEMRTVLRSMLDNVGWERRGPSANAIRHQNVSERVVRDVSNNPEKYLDEQKVIVLPRTLSSFPNEKQYVSDAIAEEFKQQIRWTMHPPSIQHDYEVFVVTARMRNGRHRKNIFENNVVLVTPNHAFVRSATEFSLSRFLTNEMQCPIAVTQQAFAAAVWLKAGAESARQLSISQLLTACERVAAVHPGILQEIRSTLSRIKPAALQEFEVLMSDRRCLDIVSSSTLNDQSSISETSTLQLIDALEAELTKELNTKHEDDLRRVQDEHNQQLNAIHERAEKNASEQREREIISAQLLKQIKVSELAAKKTEVAKIELRISATNESIKKFSENWYGIAWGLLSLFVGCISFIPGWQFGVPSIIAISAFYGAGLLRWGWAGSFRKWIEKLAANRALRSEFSVAEQARWLIFLDQRGDVPVCQRSQEAPNS